MPRTPTELESPPRALLRHPDGDRWRVFPEAREVVVAPTVDDVAAAIREADAAARAGLWAVGFVTYEAAAAFDEAHVTHPPDSIPAAWFALCDPPTERVTAELPPGGSFETGALEPKLSAEDHARGVRRVREWIASGDTYQVNYTHRLESRFTGDPWGLFRLLWRNQRARHAAWIDTGAHAICSVSPELFFRLEDGRVTCRPMKGTRPRGRHTTEDRQRASELASSAKDRAENVMIVDMIRNDLGRVAEAGSVRTESLFDVERYETVFQLTSTVSALTTADAPRVLSTLFPCASITGAPKVRTMELIARLEPEPRGVYTGAIGCLAPGGHARFGVAIRTATVDRAAGRMSYGTGGGIVWDSQPASEYRETLDKTRVLTSPAPEFALLETLLWEPDRGYRLLAEHLDRLEDSARYFGVPCERTAIRDLLEHRAPGGGVPARVRLVVARDGGAKVASEPVKALGGAWRIDLAPTPVDSTDVFLFHKTTHRGVYERARRERPDADDVLLWNERGELTESTLANVVLLLDGERVTPPVDSGLLPGTQRRRLIERGEVSERRLTLNDLSRCESLWLVNSVRGWLTTEPTAALKRSIEQDRLPAAP